MVNAHNNRTEKTLDTTFASYNTIDTNSEQAMRHIKRITGRTGMKLRTQKIPEKTRYEKANVLQAAFLLKRL